jgi:hypothetical protein
MRIVRLTAFTMAWLVGTCGLQARAGFVVDVTPTVTPIPADAGFLYSYLVSNPVSNGDDGDPDLLFSFTLNVATSANLTAINSPIGWDVSYTAGDTGIGWTASSEDVVIAPGDSLSFGFTSLLGPGSQDYGVLALNMGGTNVDFVGGATLGPLVSGAVVPEPSTLQLLMTVPACLLPGLLFRIRASATHCNHIT